MQIICPSMHLLFSLQLLFKTLQCQTTSTRPVFNFRVVTHCHFMIFPQIAESSSFLVGHHFICVLDFFGSFLSHITKQGRIIVMEGAFHKLRRHRPSGLGIISSGFWACFGSFLSHLTKKGPIIVMECVFHKLRSHCFGLGMMLSGF